MCIRDSDWELYDTAHAVFRPKHMSAEELEEGYAWIYQRLFSHASIWRRRPTEWQAIAPYLAMSYLYKRSNRFWRLLIKPVSYTHLRAHETVLDLVCRLLLEKQNKHIC